MTNADREGASPPGVMVRNLTRHFGAVEAVRGISFDIGAGEILGLLGPNGAGKTTTFSMLATLLPPTSGDAEIFGHSLVTDARAVRSLVGVVPQEISLYPDLTARENLEFFGTIYRVPRRELAERTAALLDLVGLSARADHTVATFSGGMKRRLNLACGLVHRPRLLLLDEPTVGVDPQSRTHILDAIAEIARGGTMVLYTTHYMEEAQRLCDRVAIMDEGKLVAIGTLDELLKVVDIGEVIEIRGDANDDDRARLRDLPPVRRFEANETGIRLFVDDARTALLAVASVLAANGRTIEGLEVRPVNLEQVFLQLTGKALRN